MIDENLHEVDVKEYIDIKRKGFFKYGNEIPLGDSVNEQVIAKALDLYYSQGISIDESIRNPEKYGFHIYDYCKSNKIAKNYKVWYNEKIVQNLNRYYFSKEAPYLFKRKNEQRSYNESDRKELESQFQLQKGANGTGYEPGFKPYNEGELKRLIDNQIYGSGTFQHVNVGEGVILFNIFEEKPWKDYNINYNHYTMKARKIINEISEKQRQKSLFDGY